MEMLTSVTDLHQSDADPDHSGLLEAPQFPNFYIDAAPQHCFYEYFCIDIFNVNFAYNDST
jgi:hypothetical protein